MPTATTLHEAIAPGYYEVASTFPIGKREHTVDADTAVAIARQWLMDTRFHCVQITAYGTLGPPTDHGFAVRNLEYANDKILDSGWRCWLGANRFIGAVDD